MSLRTLRIWSFAWAIFCGTLVFTLDNKMLAGISFICCVINILVFINTFEFED